MKKLYFTIMLLLITVYAHATIVPDILYEPCNSLTFQNTWTDFDHVNGATTVNPAGQFQLVTNTHDTGNYAEVYGSTAISLPSQVTVEIKTYFDSLGTYSANCFALQLATSTFRFTVYLASDRVRIEKASGSTDIGDKVKHDANAAWQTWRFQIDKTTENSATVEVFLDGVSQGTFDCNKTGTYTDKWIMLKLSGTDTDNLQAHIEHVYVGTGLGEFSTSGATTGVHVLKSSDNLYIRTAFDNNFDLVEQLRLNSDGLYNLLAGYYSTSLVNRFALDANMSATFLMVKSSTDDIAPLSYNGTYIGGNHGASIIKEITASGHGKTNVDVGSRWTDSTTTNQWYIVKIVDANKLWIMSNNLTPTGNWSFNKTIAGTTLTHVSGATNTGNITISDSSTTQFHPAAKADTVTITIDGTTPITENGVYTGTYLTIQDDYSISNPSSTLTYLIANVGTSGTPDYQNASIGNDVSLKVTYRWNDNGSCVIKHVYNFINSVTLGYIGGVQANAMVLPTGGNYKYYIPNVSSITAGGTPYDFNSIVSLESLPFPGEVSLTSDYYLKPDYPPDRIVQWNTNSDTTHYYNFGMAFGLNQDVGAGVPRILKQSTSKTMYVSTPGKMYPQLVNSSTYYPSGVVPAGTTISAITYRAPINYADDTDATCFTWYDTGDNIYVLMDYHANVNKSVQFPTAWAGKYISIIDKSTSFTVSQGLVPANGQVPIVVTDSYGYAVLRVSDKVPAQPAMIVF